ncbi:DUF6898 family protein [Zavarzinia sp. CC-PAN008]|uniref:DUF6898 family protein n=1 Tax=Zavarzinia sp. CC-PAN008 TaxID=3243332 RepID=UPI003F74A8CA
MAGRSEEGFLIEVVRIGNSAKATAVDPVTGREASIIGPANYSPQLLGRQAARKLAGLLARDKGG